MDLSKTRSIDPILAGGSEMGAEILRTRLAGNGSGPAAQRNPNRTGEGDGQMKASVLVGAGWDAGRSCA